MKRNSQSGIALVITLVLLSVITFMAVTFLVVSRHEGAQVDVITQQSNAKFAAESGAQQAMAQIVAQMQANNNGLANYGLMVSQNYLSGTNFVTGNTSITNVSYAGITAQNDLLQMLNNLLILPRPPVFITNKALGLNDFRFWLDLNRNGIYDPSGSVQVVDSSGNIVSGLFANEVGDPEWIGVLNHPEQRHSSSNFFVQRFAYIALPIGNSLDINYIHNQAVQNGSMQASLGRESGAFLRNEGVGTWEINLGAFFNKLSTNFWPILPSQSYNPLIGPTPSSDAYNDAAAIVQYRYNKSYANVSNFPSLYGNAAATAFANDFIDGYGTGPLLTNTFPITAESGDKYAMFTASPRYSWSGANNPNQFFTLGDFFAANLFQARSGGITNAFYSASTNKATDDHYAFYRMLSQLSFGSQSPEYPYQNPPVPALAGNVNFMSAYSNSPRMNLNYKNVNGVSSTAFTNWTPLEFFTNAADRMLRAYYPTPLTNVVNAVTNTFYISLTNIPVYPNNFYTPAVHRILQLAANMYDSVNTNRYYDTLTPNGPFLPSVFQPGIIKNVTAGATNIYIAGYREIIDTNSGVFGVPLDLRRRSDIKSLPSSTLAFTNVYGLPYVIGARTGWPSFNKFASLPMIQIFREMEVARPHTKTAFPNTNFGFNIRYTLSISNCLAVECWYPSSSNFFPRAVDIYVGDESDMWITNDIGMSPRHVPGSVALYPTNYAANQWRGSPGLTGVTNISSLSFQLVLSNTVGVVSNEYLSMASKPPILVPTNGSGAAIPFETTTNYLMPNWGLNITNRVRLVMVDHQSQRIVDVVQLGGLGQMPGPDVSVDLTANLIALDNKTDSSYRFWITNKNTAGVPMGFYNQVATSEGLSGYASPPNYVWTGLSIGGNTTSLTGSQPSFYKFINYQSDPSITTDVKQAGLVAYRNFQILNYTWAANDPLVHYTTSDLANSLYQAQPYNTQGGSPLYNDQGIPFGTVKTKRYQPWRSNNGAPLTNIPNNEIAYKDPLITNSDAWQFPTNKFPNVGWLGRVHRGTPWQTVYLKSGGIAGNDWQLWTGNGIDPQVSWPTNDYLLMDLFTTAPNDNASRGQLSVNQSGAAAWAAVLDGVIALTNSSASGTANLLPWLIDPANTTSIAGATTNTVDYLINSINSTRAAAPYNGTFTSVGQICAVPQLTVSSPFIDPNGPLLSDAVYERIPQQIMSLLRLGSPRYVIFAYGQSLKPADRSIVTSGPFFGMCTNYQITGEVATRTVVRFDSYPTPGSPNSPRAVVESFNVLPPE